MTSAPAAPAPVSKTARWIGRALCWLPMPMFLMSAYYKFAPNADVEKGFGHLGVPMSHATGLGVLELACVLVFLIPRTAVLGAILLTGYLGGAIQTHVRVGDPVYTHVVLGVALWAGVFLREPRLRALLPLRRCG